MNSWEAYWNIGFKPGHKGQTLFKLEEMHNRLGEIICRIFYFHDGFGSFACSMILEFSHLY